MTIPEIDVEQLAALRQLGAHIIDVRNADEYVKGHVPGARLIPLTEVEGRIDEIPDDERVYVVCAVGARSRRASELYRSRGVDATNVAGGTRAWVDAGLAVVTGDEPG